MPRKPKPPPFDLVAPGDPAAPPRTPPRLPLAETAEVRLVIEGGDFAGVEAAAAELKARFGPRFAVTGRRRGERGALLRITASLRTRPDDALDAEPLHRAKDWPPG